MTSIVSRKASLLTASRDKLFYYIIVCSWFMYNDAVNYSDIERRM
jgi:glutamate/tyrosine decarboxylase-like PLP-dependent enzyme